MVGFGKPNAYEEWLEENLSSVEVGLNIPGGFLPAVSFDAGPGQPSSPIKLTTD